MRIVYLSFSDLTSRSANAVHVAKMAEAMALNGHDITLFSSGLTQSEEQLRARFNVAPSFANVAVKRVAPGIFGSVQFPLRVAAIVNAQEPPDLLYARHALSLAMLARTGIKMIYEVHAPPHSRFSAVVERWLLRRHNLAHIIVVSRALGVEYERRYPWMNGRIIVAHDGADVPADPAAARHPPRQEIGQQDIRVGYVGHLYPGRGIDIILHIARRLPAVGFDIVGGTDADIAYWRGRPLPTNVQFHGYVPHSAIGRYLEQFTIVLAPYQLTVRESGGRIDTQRWMSPLKLFEYMAHARPMVVSDLPVLREVLCHERTALLVPPDDLDAWIEAVGRLCADPGLRQELGTRAYSELTSRYSWRIRAKNVIAPLLE